MTSNTRDTCVNCGDPFHHHHPQQHLVRQHPPPHHHHCNCSHVDDEFSVNSDNKGERKNAACYTLMTLEDTCSGGRNDDDDDDDEQVNLTTTEQSPRSEVPTTTVTSSSLASFSPSLQGNTRVNLLPSPSLSLSREEQHQLFVTVTTAPATSSTCIASSSVIRLVKNTHINSSSHDTCTVVTPVKQSCAHVSSSITSTSYTLPQVTVTNSSPIIPLRTVQSTETLVLSSCASNHQLTSLCTSTPDLLIDKVSTSTQRHHLHSSACKSTHFKNQPVTSTSTVEHRVTSVASPTRHSTQVTWTPCNVTTSIIEYNKRHSLTHPRHLCEYKKSRSKSISHQVTQSLVKSVSNEHNSCKSHHHPESSTDRNTKKMSIKSDQECNSIKINESRSHDDKWHQKDGDDDNDDHTQLNQLMIDSNRRSKNHDFNSHPTSLHSDHDVPIVHESIVLIERETWDKKTEFLLAVIGFAVDLGNVWRFPFICYRNGGGAFLIPWIVMLIFGGLPLFYLELALGQYYRNGCLTLWKRICPIMKGIGYAICLTDLYMAMYYNTVIAWALYYLMASFTTELPWTHCNNEWNTQSCMLLHQRSGNVTNATSPAEEFFERQVLQMHQAGGFDDIGPIKWSLAFCLAFVFILVYFSLWKGVKSSGKAVWITATMPYFVLFALLIRGITLEGSYEGIMYYLSPQWNKLYEISVWIDAATQIFFSLGPGFGTLLALSSYNKFHNNCYRDAIFTSTINCLTSFLAGFVIFSVLGYMAFVLKKDVSNVAADGPGLVFVVYPEAIANMPGSVIWSILFFIMLITLGLDSTFGGLEAVITGLCDEYPHVLRIHREYFVAVLLLFIWICALPTTTYGGTYVVTFLDAYGTSTSLLFIVFIEAVAVCWFYGSSKISKQIKQMLGFTPGIFWRICWKYITPIFLFALLSASIYNSDDLGLKNYQFPRWSVTAGWLLTMSSVSCIPIYAVYMLATQTTGTLKQRFIASFKPSVIVDVCECGHNDFINDVESSNARTTASVLAAATSSSQCNVSTCPATAVVIVTKTPSIQQVSTQCNCNVSKNDIACNNLPSSTCSNDA